MAKISATILTYNEADRIDACLESIKDVVDEIIVVDSFSTDDTVAICKRHGCKVSQRYLAGYGAQRQYATSLTSHSYVLSIDADEVLSPALRTAILNLKREGFGHRGYCMARLNFYCGHPVRHCGWYPDMQVRLFDKRYANWNLNDVAEQVIFRDNIRPALLDGDILHYRCNSPEEFIATEQKHAEITGRNLAESDVALWPFSGHTAGVKAYLHCLLRQGGICDGLAGRDISRQRFRSAVTAHNTAKKIRKQK